MNMSLYGHRYVVIEDWITEIRGDPQVLSPFIIFNGKMATIPLGTRLTLGGLKGKWASFTLWHNDDRIGYFKALNLSMTKLKRI